MSACRSKITAAVFRKKSRRPVQAFCHIGKKGTSLGLVLVEKMMAKMNGSLETMSRLKFGTTVDILIPEGADDAREQKNTSDY